MAEVKGRMARVKGGFDKLATMMSKVQDAVERQGEGSTGAEGGCRSSRRRHQPSSRAPRGRSSSSWDQMLLWTITRVHAVQDLRAGEVKTLFSTSVILWRNQLKFLVNIRTVLIMLKQGEQVEGLLEHMELMCEKALTKVYRINSLVCTCGEVIRVWRYLAPCIMRMF